MKGLRGRRGWVWRSGRGRRRCWAVLVFGWGGGREWVDVLESEAEVRDLGFGDGGLVASFELFSTLLRKYSRFGGCLSECAAEDWP